MRALHYVVILRDQLDRLAALARSSDAPAQQALCAITNWDAEGRCINCKAAPLPLPEAFILVLQDDDKTWGAGICLSCAADESKLVELAREHVLTNLVL
jgi:hypothetical protein